MSTMFTHNTVNEAMVAGFTFVCAMCERLHEGRKAGEPWGDGVRCTGDGCCGPIGGQSYPKYAGPIKHVLERFCCFCGQPNPESMVSSNLEGNDRTRMLGCCSKHVKIVEARHGFKAEPAGVAKKTKINLFGHEVEL